MRMQLENRWRDEKIVPRAIAIPLSSARSVIRARSRWA
ncbi:hypothetical protein AKJ09_08019 [Labilithrix luteola]|uniref:Uncharacterized protein n=1 Tax=Labilithrix luteola TaxID=1391654 RepID=A0A0K1Q6A0_9BACT|nr:hypothetical protein AKJ09_08019 [Labilithrix luteola]